MYVIKEIAFLDSYGWFQTWFGSKLQCAFLQLTFDIVICGNSITEAIQLPPDDNVISCFCYPIIA